jgi:hypothetical protein
MEKMLTTMMVCAFMAESAYAQLDVRRPAMRADSPEFRELSRLQSERMTEHEAEHKKQVQLGIDLFGASKMWTEASVTSLGWIRFGGGLSGEKRDRSPKTKAMESRGVTYFGTLGKKPRDYQVGDWGIPLSPFTTVQKTASNALLVQAGINRHDDVVLLLHGLDVTKVTDDIVFWLPRAVVITKTESYITVNGTTKTVLVLECDEKKVSKVIAEQLEKDEKAGFRLWTRVDTDSMDFARYVESGYRHAILEGSGGTRYSMEFDQMAESDRKYISEETKRRYGNATTESDSEPDRNLPAGASTAQVAAAAEREDHMVARQDDESPVPDGAADGNTPASFAELDTTIAATEKDLADLARNIATKENGLGSPGESRASESRSSHAHAGDAVTQPVSGTSWVKVLLYSVFLGTIAAALAMHFRLRRA